MKIIRKKIWGRRILCGMLLCVLLLFGAAWAEDGEAVLEEQETTETEWITDAEVSLSNAAEGYVQRVMYPARNGLIRRSAKLVGTSLDQVNKAIYMQLSARIKEVAAGNLTSTEFDVAFSDVFENTKFTLADLAELGVETIVEGGKLTTDAKDAAKALLLNQVDKRGINKALLLDLPYDLYWFDKVNGGMASNETIKYSGTSKYIQISGGSFHFKFTVSADYAGEELYTVNPTYGQGARKAAETAQGIVAKYESLSNYARLLAYRNEICDLATYNQEAFDEIDSEYGNPWQLVWVFDGDPDTAVVCEGYAKAFKYLNDLSSSPVTVISVSGVMDTVFHMWNIVQMEDGENYLVDLTNCDTGMVGEPTALFLAGAAEGSVSDGYTVLPYGKAVRYVYDQLPFSEADLTLSEASYLENQNWVTESLGEGTCVITKYKGEDTEIAIPARLRKEKVIGLRGTDGAVFGTSVTKVVLPDGITMIGENAFAGCGQLKDLEIPDGVKTIGENAFLNCASLTEMGLPSGLQSIGSSAFARCTGLNLIRLPGLVPEIGENAFAGLSVTVIYKPDAAWEGKLTAYGAVNIEWQMIGGSCGTSATWKLIAPGVLWIEGSGIPSESGWRNIADDSTIVIIGEGITGLGATTFGQMVSIEKLIFEGDAPRMEADVLERMTGRVFIRHGAAGWDQEIRDTAGGEAEWIRYCSQENGEVVLFESEHTEGIEFNCEQEGRREYWTCIHCGKNFLDEEGSIEATEEDLLPTPAGHHYMVEVTWSEDGTTGTAVFTCERGDSVLNVTVQPSEMMKVKTPAGLETIEAEAFAGSAVTGVLIADGALEIEEKAFADCAQLQQIVLPDTMRVIKKSAFEGCAETLVIMGARDSVAEEFAQENRILFIPLDEE